MTVTAASTLRIQIESIAFWSSRLPDWKTARAVMRNEQEPLDTPQARPTPSLLAPTERRRAPDTVALALEVALQACKAADLAPHLPSTVFASTYGDLAITDYMCATLAATPTLVSPTKFHNSVHNAAAGYWSIGAHSLAPYIAISAGKHTFACGLLEAVVQAMCGDRPVLYVAYDIEARGPLATMTSSVGLLATALILSPHQTPTSSSLTVELLNVSESLATTTQTAIADAVAGNPLTIAMPFFEALAAETHRVVDLPLSEGLMLRTTIAVHR
jgi:hypothetical protein